MHDVWALLTASILAQAMPDETWAKIFIQLGIAGAWLWWLTSHLKEQTKRDDRRHEDNVKLARHHAQALERLTLTIYDVLDELGNQFPHAKVRIRQAIRADAKKAVEELNQLQERRPDQHDSGT